MGNSALCKVKECKDLAKSKGYCGKHYARVARTGNTNITRRENGTGNINKGGYIDHCINGRRVYEHVLIAEKALGKRLPTEAIVHHVNGNKSDNMPKNLVICQNEKYHRLLHIRQDALNGCGNANYRKCCYCKQYDDLVNLKTRDNGWQPRHIQCQKEYDRLRNRRKNV